eukprot:TRINITY_DN3291_c0_g1_i1.p3 TRINITY_DN3291_c0_g1~~TRINITY_DN3291_c0_g1_i1.p3  ORF type:complete len:125 (-),score=19.90 TRINITY_DN3291_c0_g1_i1:715-1089(-)
MTLFSSSTLTILVSHSSTTPQLGPNILINIPVVFPLSVVGACTGISRGDATVKFDWLEDKLGPVTEDRNDVLADAADVGAVIEVEVELDEEVTAAGDEYDSEVFEGRVGEGCDREGCEAEKGDR